METEAPKPTRGLQVRGNWKPRLWFISNTQAAISLHSPQWPAPEPKGASASCV